MKTLITIASLISLSFAHVNDEIAQLLAFDAEATSRMGHQTHPIQVNDYQQLLEHDAEATNWLIISQGQASREEIQALLAYDAEASHYLISSYLSVPFSQVE